MSAAVGATTPRGARSPGPSTPSTLRDSSIPPTSPGATALAAPDKATFIDIPTPPGISQAAVPTCIEDQSASVLERRDDAQRLGDDIAELSARIQAATYELLVMIRAFDEREGWAGFVSCAHWLNWRTGLALGAAREKVRVARALRELPLLSEAMQRGRVSYSKVRALTRVATPANERRLLDFALSGTAAHVERLARAWRRVDRLAEGADEQRRQERRSLTTWVDDDGMVVIRGRLSPEVGAVVRRALEAAADRLRAEVSPEEAAETSVGQRQADALGVVAESALAADLDRGTAGDRYQVVLHVEAEMLRAEGGEPDVSAETRLGDAERTRVPAETLAAAVPTAIIGPAGAVIVGSDVSAETSSGAAGVRACADTSGCPAPAVPSDRVSGQAALEDADGLRVSAETAKRMACDAAVVVMRHGADGSVLDIGRKTRTIPPALRRALQARDRQCRFPGCHARRCDDAARSVARAVTNRASRACTSPQEIADPGVHPLSRSARRIRSAGNPSHLRSPAHAARQPVRRRPSPRSIEKVCSVGRRPGPAIAPVPLPAPRHTQSRSRPSLLPAGAGVPAAGATGGLGGHQEEGVGGPIPQRRAGMAADGPAGTGEGP